MTHPFPRNLPLLRRIYADRFSAVRFILPFERSADADVITVYRGSYVHAAYLTDARAELERLDCDYYMVVQDDVLLNPRISEAEFFDFFDLGEDEGFIPVAGPVSGNMGDWIWYYGFLAKLLFPKSILFGSGVEAANLAKYLPSAEALHAALDGSAIPFTRSVRLDPDDMAPIAADASRLLLHGLAAPLGATPLQKAIEEQSLRIERELVAAMLAARQERGDGDMLVELPVPIVGSAYFTDFYILPRSGFADFCHYMGVFGAANLFVEISAPTALVAACGRVRQAIDFGLDFSGFDVPKEPHWFFEPKAAAIHPIKLSTFDTPARQDAFVELLAAIRDGRTADADRVALASFGLPLSSIVRDGWSAPERWGCWSVAPRATLEIALAGPTALRLHLRAPIDSQDRSMSGRLSFNGGDEVSFAAEWPSPDVVLDVPGLRPDADGVARLILSSDPLVVPSARGDGSLDHRTLGFGLLTATWGTTTARGYMA